MKLHIILLACVSSIAFSQEATDRLTEFPGKEYGSGEIRRSMRPVTPEDLVEGSPIWIVYQVIAHSKAMNFDALTKLQSPAQIRAARQNTPEQMDALVGGILLDDTVKVGDSKEEGSRYYVYLTFKREDGRKRSFYSYFLRVDGKWLSVTGSEWQQDRLEQNK